ncbi:Gmad2 immunoglobulin-like domain-containing protein [Neobacillus sp. LXY-4]|uniref:Gmad2 immunoglobulin-like domain-containing protein n=1 Tax=Neobacillus sp. LXY-4 TaxID=3379826 RepID=UPI003EE07771
MKKTTVLVTMLLVLAIFPTLQVHGKNIISEVHGEPQHQFFRNVKVKGQGGEYVVKGEARPVTGSFYYVVEDGHRIFVKETKVVSKKAYPAWTKFKVNIKIPKRLLPDNGTVTMFFYEKAKQSDDMIHVVPIVLEEFY